MGLQKGNREQERGRAAPVASGQQERGGLRVRPRLRKPRFCFSAFVGSSVAFSKSLHWAIRANNSDLLDNIFLRFTHKEHIVKAKC